MRGASGAMGNSDDVAGPMASAPSVDVGEELAQAGSAARSCPGDPGGCVRRRPRECFSLARFPTPRRERFCSTAISSAAASSSGLRASGGEGSADGGAAARGAGAWYGAGAVKALGWYGGGVKAGSGSALSAARGGSGCVMGATAGAWAIGGSGVSAGSGARAAPSARAMRSRGSVYASTMTTSPASSAARGAGRGMPAKSSDSSAAISPALAKRALGRGEAARRTSASTGSGSAGFFSKRLSCASQGTPASISASSTPRLKTSVRASSGSPKRNSGAR